jgi:hypothetical protein
MPLSYNNTNILINGKTVLAESLSLSQESPQKPAYTINNLQPFGYVPTNYKANLNINYTIETSGEPNYLVISGWKANNATGNLNALINLGNISFTGYLSNFGFNLTPNNTVKAQATYQIFNPLTGNFTVQRASDSGLYNPRNSMGIAHYWSAEMTTNNTAVTNNDILQLDYTFNANIEPQYKIGSPYPCQVSCFGAQEEINLVNQTQNNVHFSGQNYDTILNTINNVRLKNISSTWGDTTHYIDFSLSGMKVQTSKVDINIENIIVFNHNISRNY